MLEEAFPVCPVSLWGGGEVSRRYATESLFIDGTFRYIYSLTFSAADAIVWDTSAYKTPTL